MHRSRAEEGRQQQRRLERERLLAVPKEAVAAILAEKRAGEVVVATAASELVASVWGKRHQ